MIINNSILEINLNNSSSYILNLLDEAFKDKEPIIYIEVRIMIGGTKIASSNISKYNIALEYVNKHISLYKSYMVDILNKVPVPAKQIITPVHAIESIDDLNTVIACVREKEDYEHEIYVMLSQNDSVQYKKNTENVLKVLDFMQNTYRKSERVFDIVWSSSAEFDFDYIGLSDISPNNIEIDAIFSNIHAIIAKIITNRDSRDKGVTVELSTSNISYLHQVSMCVKFYDTDECIDWLINSHIKYLQFKQDMIKSAKDKGIYDIYVIQNFIARGLN